MFVNEGEVGYQITYIPFFLLKMQCCSTMNFKSGLFIAYGLHSRNIM